MSAAATWRTLIAPARIAAFAAVFAFGVIAARAFGMASDRRSFVSRLADVLRQGDLASATPKMLAQANEAFP